MERYTREQYLQLVPQRGVRQCFIDAPGYNAAWDYAISPDGRHFIALCAEGNFPEYAKLYEYLPESNEMRMCFDLEKSIIVYPRTIRPSKIHTSINFMPDGKLIMTTHTTACAPTHPSWMPEAYYTHLWEGFHGSNVLIYDSATGKVEDLGIPVPRDTIYGAAYIPETKSLFFMTFLRGHTYRLSLEDRSVTDFGQCSEMGSYYYFRATDGNFYFSTRSGDLWRINIKKNEPEYLNVTIPLSEGRLSEWHNVMAYADNGPDGRMYFCAHEGRYFFAYDCKTNKIEKLGLTIPEGMREKYPDSAVFGIAFDRFGVMWYTVSTNALHLCCWDITKPDTQPEELGLVGTHKYCQLFAENIYIRDDVLYLADTNHDTPPGITSIDLSALREDVNLPHEIAQDPVLYYKKEELRDLYIGDVDADTHHFIAQDEFNKQFSDVLKANPFAFGNGKRWVCKLWRVYGMENAVIRDVDYDTDGNAVAYINANGGMKVTTHDGEIIRTESCTTLPFHDNAERLSKGLLLPCHPGRQYLAVATACGKMEDGCILIGTKDGMLALVRNGKVFSLGAVCNDGPIHAITVRPDGKKAYGVAGDPDSLGLVFSYDLEEGIALLGHIFFQNGDSREGTGISCEPFCVAYAPDGKRITIGVRDRLGCIYEYEV